MRSSVVTRLLSRFGLHHGFRRVTLGVGSVGDRHEQLACRACCCTVHLHPGLACGFPGGREFIGYGTAGAEVHLVGRLTTERGVGKTHVVFVHVERDQLLERADRVERVQVQPLVFDRSPPRFDERVGKRDLGHGQKSSQQPGVDQFVDGTVEVLDSAVGQESWFFVDQATRGAEKQFGRRVAVERCRDLPRQDAA